MASLPPRHSQRRASPAQSPSTGSSAGETRQESGRGDGSVESQTRISSPSQSDALVDTHTDVESRPGPPQVSPSDVRKCWICLMDETEDGPKSSPWRTPCPCALTAHEACLLDWVADLEVPHNNQAYRKKEVHCPQCKSEIVLARPKNKFVELIGTLDNLASRMILPTAILGTLQGVVVVMKLHGAHSIRMVFGEDEAREILGTAMDYVGFTWRAPIDALPLMQLPTPTWRGTRNALTEMSLPVIPAALILSRTSFSSSILPFLPLVIFANQHSLNEAAEVELPYWPPSASLAFCLLPYIGQLYHDYMDRFWAPLERQWMSEIRPRRDEDEEEAPLEAAAPQPARNDVVEVEMEVEMNVEMEAEEFEHLPAHEHEEAHEHVPGLHDPPQDDDRDARQERAQQRARDYADEIAARLQEAANRQQPQQHRPHFRIGGEYEDLISIVGRMISALLLPTFSAAIGQGLQLLLPRSWTTPPTMGFMQKKALPTGILQTRWGRTIVAGCLAVGAKDALRIFCRWRTAQSFKKRRILDYDKQAGRLVYP